MRIYSGITLIGTDTSINGVDIHNSTHFAGKLFGASILAGASAANIYGIRGLMGGLRFTKAARPAPTTATFALFPTYAAQITGLVNITTPAYGWGNSVCYPDFNLVAVAGVLPNDLSVGKIGISDGNAVIPLTSETINGFATHKATFNGSMKYTLSAQYDTLFSKDFTIEAWVYPTTLTGEHLVVSGGTGQASLSLSGSQLLFGIRGVSAVATGGTLVINTWQKIAVTRVGNLFTIYINNVSVGSGTYALGVVTTGVATIGWDFASTAGLGFVGSMAEILISTGGKTSFAPLTARYPRSIAKAQTPITEWVVTGVSSTGLTCTTTVNTTVSTTYTLDTPSIEPYTVTLSPKIDAVWTASTALTTGKYVVPTSPDTDARLYKVTTAGTTAASEPAWVGNTVTSGTVVFTYVAELLDPVSLGAKIPS